MAPINALDNKIYHEELEKLLSKPTSRSSLYQEIVDGPFHNKVMSARLGLGICVLLLVNKEEGTIDRIALAKTDLAQSTLEISAKPFEEIKIPANHKDNYIARAIRRKHYMITSDWQYLFVPALTPEEARFNQAGGGIACSVIYPLDIKGGGALIFSYYEPVDRIDKNHHHFMQSYAHLASKYLRNLT
jgi:hypothetical protein